MQTEHSTNAMLIHITDTVSKGKVHLPTCLQWWWVERDAGHQQLNLHCAEKHDRLMFPGLGVNRLFQPQFYSKFTGIYLKRFEWFLHNFLILNLGAGNRFIFCLKQAALAYTLKRMMWFVMLKLLWCHPLFSPYMKPQGETCQSQVIRRAHPG